MEKGNVLVIGNSGVGKSTLINAVLGENCAITSWGTHGTTKKLELYEPANENVPFRLIDTIGFEPNLIQEQRAIKAVKDWSKDCAKKGHEDNQINVIWFCIEGTKRKLFAKEIQQLSRATSMWESVPVIVVITKSYSMPERESNIEMVYQAFAMQKKHGNNLRKVIPVVAQIYQINDTAYAAPDGITELIDETNRLMPEGKKAAETDLSKFVLNRKRVLSQAVVTTATAAAAVVGAVPIPFPDGLILTPTEAAEINAISRIYGIKQDNESKKFLKGIVELGTVGVAAKTLISVLKAIPGINLAASVLNAVIAGVVVATLGEGSIYVFEQIYLGKKTVDDIDWVKQIFDSKLSDTTADKVKPILEKLTDSSSKKDVTAAIAQIVPLFFKKEDK